MNSSVFVKTYFGDESDFAIRRSEILRYARYCGDPSEISPVLSDLIERMIAKCINEKVFSYKVCFAKFDLQWEDGMPRLPFPSKSLKLAKCLSGSNEILLFATTIGYGIDQLVSRAKARSQLEALLLNAYGAERVECLCDAFCREFRSHALLEGKTTTPRFSPGYGDLSLDVQKYFFNILDCSRKIGVNLNSTLLMSPSKSVTAIFGIKPHKENK